MKDDINHVRRAIAEAKDGVSRLALAAKDTDRKRLLSAREDLCNADTQVEMCAFANDLIDELGGEEPKHENGRDGLATSRAKEGSR